MRYLLMDRVIRVERDRSLRAIKNVTLAEDVYADHFLGFPVMPGALMIEVAAQAGTALLEVSGNFQKKALLAMVDRAKFRSMVRPGDQLTIDAVLAKRSAETAQVVAELRVGETLVMDSKLVFSLRPSEQFYPQKTRHLVETAYDIWLDGTEMLGFDESR
ncbi:MAG TPA: 3-hydroxyacyl-ACP dehydratase FabZ family protein [Gammaproteobacteria bacterium]